MFAYISAASQGQCCPQIAGTKKIEGWTADIRGDLFWPWDIRLNFSSESHITLPQPHSFQFVSCLILMKVKSLCHRTYLTGKKHQIFQISRVSPDISDLLHGSDRIEMRRFLLLPRTIPTSRLSLSHFFELLVVRSFKTNLCFIFKTPGYPIRYCYSLSFCLQTLRKKWGFYTFYIHLTPQIFLAFSFKRFLNF